MPSLVVAEISKVEVAAFMLGNGEADEFKSLLVQTAITLTSLGKSSSEIDFCAEDSSSIEESRR